MSIYNESNDDMKKFIFDSGVVLKNRLVLAPMTTYSSNVDLTLSDEEEIYYQKRGEQFGMVITAATAINKNAQAFQNQISIRDVRYLDSMTRLAQAIKKGGAKAIVQLHHGGRMNVPNMYPNQDIVSASPIKALRDYTVVPRELKTGEVYDIIDDFMNALKIAYKAGFDGVEFHGANTYLIQQFFSPHSNQRNDEFGGSLEKRATFSKELIKRANKLKNEQLRDDFIIGYRMSPEELENPGITIEDTLYLIDELTSIGLDYIHLSTSSYKQTSIRDESLKDLLVDRVSKVINGRTTLIGVGGIQNKEDVKDGFSKGYDLLAVGMAALVDENFVSHIKEGVEPKRVLNKDSLLPTKMFDRLSSWLKSSKRYSVKQ